MDIQAGSRVDRYIVEGLLGQGGMAAVYRVRHESLGTSYALKVLTLPAKSIQKRLLQEGRVQAALRHPNVVSVTDVIDVQGAPGLVMELVAGPSLDAFLRDHALTLDQADALGRGILEGVAAAHEAGLIHRDLKPGNILLEIRGGELIPKITDFGLAKVLEVDGAGNGMTRSGLAMGTPSYMAPEQIRSSKHVDHRADIFSLGCVLYELLTTERAFEGEDTFEVFSQITSGRYRPVEDLRPDVPERMIDAITGALQTERDERVGSVRALLATWSGAEPQPAASGPWSAAALNRAVELGSGGKALDASFPAGATAADATLDFVGGQSSQGGSLSSAMPSLPAPSLPAPSLPAPSLPAPSLPAPSLPAQSQPSLEATRPPPEPPAQGSSRMAFAVGGGLLGMGVLVAGTVAVAALLLGVLFVALRPAPPVVAPEPAAASAVEEQVVEEQVAAPVAEEPVADPITPEPVANEQAVAPAPKPAAAPAPEPAVAEPEPEAPATREPVGATGTVTYMVAVHPMLKMADTLGQIWLVDATGKRRDPGIVPAGTYAIVGLLGDEAKGEPRSLGQVVVPPNGAVKLFCYSRLQECRLK